MRTKYELLEFNSHMPVRGSMQKIGQVDMHMHDFFEIIFILSGSCRITVDQHVMVLNAEDVISINGHSPHELYSRDCVLISIQFDQSLFERTLPSPVRPMFECNSSTQKNNSAFDKLRRLIARFVKNNSDRQTGYELRNWSLVYDIMDVMYNNFRINPNHSADSKAFRYTSRISDISQAIGKHYTEQYTLTMLADELHLSSPYLSKFFSQQFGMTFMQYLNQIRLNHAITELIHSDNTIEQIAQDSGFPNSHAFVQVFKKEFGTMPSVFRREVRNRESEPAVQFDFEQHDYMSGLKKYLAEPESSAPDIQYFTCSVRLNGSEVGRKLEHKWRNVLSISNAKDLLFGDIQEMIARVQREVGFKYISFNGVFSDELRVCSQDSSGRYIYNYIYIDKIIDFVLENNLRPFIHLSYMPSCMAKNPGRMLFNNLVSEPKDIADWSDLVSNFIEHLRSRYGSSQVRTWLFSIWHQPDTPSSMYGFNNDEVFYKFYQATYKAVKKSDFALRLGAPSTFYIIRKGYENWYLRFLPWCDEHECTPDFLCFNYYDTVQNTDTASTKETFGFIGSLVLRDTPNGVGEFIASVERETRSMSISDIYLTEWNTSPSQQDLLNDTCFKSCYIVKSILENYDKLSSFSYWSLTDWMGEAALPSELFFGGLGMFTVNKLPKASYYAFCFLRQLGSSFVGAGEGWFATREENSYQIILYNYRHFSHLYSLGERFDMTFTERYTPFFPEMQMDCHVAVSNIPSGRYIVKERIINRAYGSAFDKWVEMGAVEMTDRQELRTLESLSVPMQNKYFVTVSDNRLELDAILEMLEVRFISIEPDHAKSNG